MPRQYIRSSPILLFIAAVILVHVLSDGIFLRPMNIHNFVLQTAPLLILTPGMVVVMIVGCIDLSVGSTAAFVGTAAAVLMVDLGLPLVPTLFLCLALGTFIGAFHGALIAFMRIPMFLVTLCGMLIWRGLTLVLLAGRTLTGFPKVFLILANGTLPNSIVNDISGTVIIFLVAIVIGLITWRVLRTPLNRRKGPLIVFTCVVAALPFALYKGLPWPLLIAALLAVVMVFITTRTTFGRRLYATGANSNAARLSGVFTRRVVFSAFVISGFTAALAGLFIAGRLNAATPKAGQSLEFEAITACLIGGVSVNGGIGTVPGALFGALILGLMDNGLSVLGSGGSDAVKAVIMLAAGLYSTLRNRVPKTLQELSSNSAD